MVCGTLGEIGSVNLSTLNEFVIGVESHVYKFKRVLHLLPH